jgi:hypothetical protein
MNRYGLRRMDEEQDAGIWGFFSLCASFGVWKVRKRIH